MSIDIEIHPPGGGVTESNITCVTQKQNAIIVNNI